MKIANSYFGSKKLALKRNIDNFPITILRSKMKATVFLLIFSCWIVFTISDIIKISKKDYPRWIFVTDIKLFREGHQLSPNNFYITISSIGSGSILSNCFDDHYRTNCFTDIIVHQDIEVQSLLYVPNDPNPWLKIDTRGESFDKIVIYNWYGRLNTMRSWIVGLHLDVYKDNESEAAGIAMFSGDINDVNLVYEFDLTRNVNLQVDQRRLSNQRQLAVVTGGGGFVGRHFVARLCRLGWIVIVVDDLSAKGSQPYSRWPRHLQQCRNSHESNNPNEPIEVSGSNADSEIVFINQDCRQFFKRRDLGNTFHVHLFLHLASIVGGRAKIEDEPFAVAEDLSIDIAAFQWAMVYQPDYMIYFSSHAAYPIAYQQSSQTQSEDEQQPVLLDESMISFANAAQTGNNFGMPDLTYGWSKLTGEFLARQLRSRYGVKVAVYRPFSGYGEDQDDSYPFPAILKRIISAAASWNVLPLSDRHIIEIDLWSNATRDFVYIEDIVRCVMSSYVDLSGSEFEAMNLASGSGTSFESLAQQIVAVIGLPESSIKFRLLGDKPKGVNYRVGGNKIASQLGCSFSTSLQEGIAIAAHFIINNASSLDPGSHRSAAPQVPVSLESKIEEDTMTSNQQTKKTSRLSDLSSKYSSHHCIGTSQGFFNMSIQHSAKDFPLSSHALYRVCHLKNVCLSEGKVLYYRDPDLATVSSEFFPLALNTSHPGSMFYTGFANVFSDQPTHLLNVEIVTNLSFPTNSPRHIRNRIAAVEAPAQSYNYGHYMFDDVIPIFSAARIFNLPFDQFVQVLHHECDSLDEVLLFGRGPLTARQACMQKFQTMWPYFFEHAPLSMPRENTMCFDHVIAGQNTALGLQSLQLTRAVELREFRDMVIKRNSKRLAGQWDQERSNATINVVVYGKGHGWWDSEIDVCRHVSMHLIFNQTMPVLCDQIEGSNAKGFEDCVDESWLFTNNKLRRIHRRRPFKVLCMDLENISFEEEVTSARQAHIIVSLHATTAYASLFAQSTTQQIMISTYQLGLPFTEAKENHILMWSTHAKARYIPYNYLESSLQSTLLLAATEVMTEE